MDRTTQRPDNRRNSADRRSADRRSTERRSAERRGAEQRGAGIRSGKTPEKARSQADFLTFQIIAVLLLAGGFWIMNHFDLKYSDDLRRMCRKVLNGDNAVVTELSSMLPGRASLEALKDRFDLSGLLRFDLDKTRADPAGEQADSSSEGSEGASAAMGGVYPHALEQLSAAPPRGSTFSPLLLCAKPRVPVPGVVTSTFGWRDNPLSPGSPDFHTGLDIAAPEGTPILAALPGAVEDAGFSENYGNYMLIRHENGLQTFYSHCSELIARPGEILRQGERVALVGQTGRVTGPHLHFELRQDSLSNDPLVHLL